jgi:hypothetical protein
MYREAERRSMEEFRQLGTVKLKALRQELEHACAGNGGRR